ncbi:MAG: ABC transporter permease subunit [Solirubrobacterales bacterium]|nr:ABC transporter permease subunit [Solirubrobacterales bacterium]
MRAQLRSELLKQRSTRTNLGLFAGLLGLVTLAVLLHGVGLPTSDLAGTDNQLMVFGRGEYLGALFAALVGAMSITAEIRHGTIRPTFLVTPHRGRVVAAKVGASILMGAGFGLAASTLAVGVGAAVLPAQGIDVQLDGGDYALLIAGGTAASALWAAIGVGIGAVVRDQVPTLLGISAWLLFVEGLFGENLVDVSRLAPGTLGVAISGQEPDTHLAPALSLLLLALYATAAAAAGWVATTRRDVV